ncbi:MAG TPA: GNAT family N-acetyltransferase [Thermoanaerobaculia bacterium]|nr:GNAT family N-acetyltransferase [Thermoanaerobaculia bacterium]
MSGFEIRDATAADAPGIRRLFERVFGHPLTDAQWRWKFEQNPDGWRATVGVLDGEVVGNYAGWGARFLVEGAARLLYSVGDVATDPSVRVLGGRRGVYREMTEAFYAGVAREVPFCYGFPNARALRVSERIVGSRTLFPIEVVSVPVTELGAPPANAEAGDSVGEAFDALWSAASRFLDEAAVRDRARVNWRFHARPDRYYRMVWRREGGAMTGWTALSIVGETATVADYLGVERDGSDLPPLFAAAADEARRLGARRLAFWVPRGGPGLAPIEALGGERLDAGFPVIVRVFDEQAVRRFADRAYLVPSLYDLT